MNRMETYDLTTRTDADMLAFRISESEYQQFSKATNLVSEYYKKIGIKTFTPTPPKFAHITVFAGINSSITAEERLYILSEMSERISNLPAIKMNETYGENNVWLKNVPPTDTSKYAFTILNFNSIEVQNLQHIAISVLKDGIAQGKIREENIQLEKLEKTSTGHLSLGIFEGDPTQVEQDKNTLKIRQMMNKYDFKNSVGNVLANEKFKFSLNLEKATLIGIKGLKGPTANKTYVNLGEVKMYVQASKPSTLMQNRQLRSRADSVSSDDQVTELNNSANKTENKQSVIENKITDLTSGRVGQTDVGTVRQSYTGPMHFGLKHGKNGLMQYADGRIYLGDWKNNEWDGFGYLAFENGRTVGRWKNGLPDGEHIVEYADGREEIELWQEGHLKSKSK